LTRAPGRFGDFERALSRIVSRKGSADLENAELESELSSATRLEPHLPSIPCTAATRAP
jgi:hypothetical protein